MTGNTYSRLELVSDFSAQMHNCQYLLPSQCGIQLVDINDINHSLNGYSRCTFQLYLNKKITTNAVNQKTVMVAPDDEFIWVGENSCFNLDVSVNETSTIKATNSYKVSDYIVGNNAVITATCNATGYINNINHVSVHITD